MSRWASQIGLSLAAYTAMFGLGIIAVWLVAAGLVLAGAAMLTAVAVYLFWLAWRARSDHAWR